MDSLSPAISVIVPVYKVEPYLDRCVKSLLVQTYSNITIILVDDGSPDRCPEMCDQYALQYDNVIALHKPNGGLSDARNYGVDHTENEWIVFVDSDDYVEPEYVETLVDLRNQFQAEMVITRTVRENEDGSRRPKHQAFESYLADKKTTLYTVYSGEKVGWAAYGKLYPKAVLLKHPFPDGYYEDCACMYRIIEEFDKIVIGDFERNYHYIQRIGSILNTDLNKKHLHIFEIAEEFVSFIRECHPDMDILVVHLYRRAIAQLLNLQNMPWKTYKELFLKYRPIFRKNFKKIHHDPTVSSKLKVYYFLLCGRPEVFFLQRKILLKIR